MYICLYFLLEWGQERYLSNLLNFLFYESRLDRVYHLYSYFDDFIFFVVKVLVFWEQNNQKNFFFLNRKYSTKNKEINSFLLRWFKIVLILIFSSVWLHSCFRTQESTKKIFFWRKRRNLGRCWKEWIEIWFHFRVCFWQKIFFPFWHWEKFLFYLKLILKGKKKTFSPYVSLKRFIHSHLEEKFSSSWERYRRDRKESSPFSGFLHIPNCST